MCCSVSGNKNEAVLEIGGAGSTKTAFVGELCVYNVKLDQMDLL